MKRFKLITLAICMVLLFAASSFATPKLLKTGMGDPRSIVIGSTMYFCGTYTDPLYPNQISIFQIPTNMITAAVPENYVTLYYRYNPASFLPGSFHDVMGASLSLDTAGNVMFSFAAKYNPNGSSYPTTESTIWMAVNLGAPVLVNAGATTTPHSIVDVCTNTSAERLKMRIDTHFFADNGTDWLTYTYFYGGNQCAMFKWRGTGSISDSYYMATAAAPDYVVEGGVLYKTGSRYHYTYSFNHFLGGYGTKYKTAGSMLDLQNAASTYLLRPQPATGVWDSQKQEYGYYANAGGAQLMNVGGTQQYLLFHITRPVTPNTLMFTSDSVTPRTRNTYIDYIYQSGLGKFIEISY